jgi:hypothetical protein
LIYFNTNISSLKFDFQKQQQLETYKLQGTVPQTEILEILNTVPQNQRYLNQFFEDGNIPNLEFKQDAAKLIEASNLEKTVKDQLQQPVR